VSPGEDRKFLNPFNGHPISLCRFCATERFELDVNAGVVKLMGLSIDVSKTAVALWTAAPEIFLQIETASRRVPGSPGTAEALKPQRWRVLRRLG
jgi:hypothetical protein